MPSFQQVDFPVAFAEAKDDYQQTDDNTVFYVEWLDNNTEFPGLAMPTDTDLDGDNWELLKRKEMIEEKEEDHTVVPVEDAWSKIVSAKGRPLYADMVGKNAELQPVKCTLQPLWPTVQLQKKPQENGTETNSDVEDYLYEDGDLGAQLLVDYKSQSRGAHRFIRRHNLNNWRNTDYYLPGILRLATTTKGWMPPDIPEYIVASLHFPFMIYYHRIKTEAQAKRWAANFMNFKTDASCTKPLKVCYDPRECSVLSPITRR